MIHTLTIADLSIGCNRLLSKKTQYWKYPSHHYTSNISLSTTVTNWYRELASLKFFSFMLFFRDAPLHFQGWGKKFCQGGFFFFFLTGRIFSPSPLQGWFFPLKILKKFPPGDEGYFFCPLTKWFFFSILFLFFWKLPTLPGNLMVRP